MKCNCLVEINSIQFNFPYLASYENLLLYYSRFDSRLWSWTDLVGYRIVMFGLGLVLALGLGSQVYDLC